MTQQNSLKRLIRERMEKTDESYSSARMNVLRRARHRTKEPSSDRAASLRVLLTQPRVRSGDFQRDLDALLDEEEIPGCDVLVLPELIGSRTDQETYRRRLGELARDQSCYVVGGSCYLPAGSSVKNSGVVVDDQGNVVTTYEKVRPYGSELGTDVVPGDSVGRFKLKGREFAVLICSDLWFSDSFASLSETPDTVLIPSLSVTQREDPSKARELWRHMLVSRAYEFAAYVGVCDWAHPCEFDGLRAAGVTGFANPRPITDSFYSSNEGKKFHTYNLDYTRLDEYRVNRDNRGFLWRPVENWSN